MRTMLRSAASAAAILLAVSVPAAGQATGLTADILKDIGEVEQKMVGLAKAMPEKAYGWKAGAARSTAEVLQHVAAENYFLPASLGVTVPAATRINPTDYNSVQAYENRKASRDEVIAELEKSFAHFKQALATVAPAQMSEEIKMFGQTFTKQRFLILTATHLHEHLGQLIAYARANDVKPPWSN